MTASASTTPAKSAAPSSNLAGFRPIFRKEMNEWIATHRFVIAALLATIFAAAGPVIYWVYKGGLGQGKLEVSGNSYDAIISAPTTALSTLGLFMVIALTMGIITREQDTGTLQWIFTKPVSRSALVLAKWLANSLMTVLAIIVIPTIISFGIIDLLFGVDDRPRLILGMVGIAILYIFQCALSCGIASITNSSASVAGISFGIVFMPIILLSITENWARLFPTSISDVASKIVQNESLDKWDYGTIIVTVVSTVLLMIFATYKLSHREYR